MGNDIAAHTTDTVNWCLAPVDGSRRGRRSVVGGLLLAALALGACAGNDDDSAATAEPAAEEAASEPAEEGAAVDTATDADAGGATGEAAQTAAPIDIDFGRDLVIEAGLVIVTPDVREAVDDVMRITRDNGGAVFDTDVVIDDPLDDGSVPGGGTITVRLPPAQLDLLIGDLRGVGTVRNQTQSVQDVTDRVTDLEVQINQARLSVERMEVLLAEATDFDGLVAAERELVNRQTTYERLLAAQRNLDDRIALSTLVIEVRYAALDSIDVTTESDDPGIADAFSDGWNAFVGVLFGVAFVLAVLTPFLVVLLVLAAVGWLATRGLRRQRRAAHRGDDPLGATPPATQDADDAELASADH